MVPKPEQFVDRDDLTLPGKHLEPVEPKVEIGKTTEEETSFTPEAEGRKIEGWGDIEERLRGWGVEIGSKVAELKKDTRTSKEVTMAQKMLLEVLKKDQLSPESARVVLGAIRQHEILIAATWAREITNNGQQAAEVALPAEAETETDRVIKEQKGFGLYSPKITDLLRRIGVKVEEVKGAGQGFLIASPEEKFKLKISFPQTGERIIHPYAVKWGVEGWSTQEVLEHLQELENLRTDVYEKFGLNPTVEHHLAMVDLGTRTQSKETFLNSIYEQRQRNLEGRDPTTLSSLELIDLELKTVDAAAVTTCETFYHQVIEGDIERYKGDRGAEVSQIVAHAEELETREKRKEDVETEVEKLQRELITAKQAVKRLESIHGTVGEEGTVSGGSIKNAKTEYYTAVEKHETTEAEYKALIKQENVGQLRTKRDTLEAQILSINGHIIDAGTKIINLETTLEATPEDQKQTIRDQIAGKRTELKQHQEALTTTSNELTNARDRLTKIVDKEAAFKSAEKAVKRRKNSVNELLGEFGQELEGTGAQEEKPDERVKKIMGMKEKVQEKEKKLKDKQEELTGKPKDEDLKHARLLRLCAGVNGSEAYNQIVGSYDAELGDKIVDSRDLTSSHDALLRALTDQVKASVPVLNKERMPERETDGKLKMEDKLITPHEKRELFTQGEAVLLAIEHYGISIDKILNAPSLQQFNNRLERITIIRGVIESLEEDRPANFEKAREKGWENIRALMSDNQLLLGTQYEKILPYISRNTEVTRGYIKHCLDYLREKAATGEVYGISHRYVYKEPVPEEERYRVEAVPKTEYGTAEFREGIGRTAVRTRGEYPNDAVLWNGESHKGLKVSFRTEIDKRPIPPGGPYLCFAEVRADQSLWRTLPSTRQRAINRGWVYESILDKFYDAAGSKRKIEAADNEMVGLNGGQPERKNTVDEVVALLKQFGLENMYPAAIYQMVNGMEQKDKQEVLSTFNTVSIRIFRKRYDVSMMNGRFIVHGGELPKEGIAYDQFTRGYEQRYRTEKAIPANQPLTPDQRKEIEEKLLKINSEVGKELIKSIQKKSRGG